MANWDVFHADRLELERGLTADAIRHALAVGDLRDDDLVRPAGTTIAWARLGDYPELLAANPPAPKAPATPAIPLAPPSASPAPPVAQPPIPPARTPINPATGDFEMIAEDRMPPAHHNPAPTVQEPEPPASLSQAGDVSFPYFDDTPRAPKSARPRVAPNEPPVPEVEKEAPEFLGAHDLEFLDDDEDPDSPAWPVPVVKPPDDSSQLALPVVTSRGWDDTGDDEEPTDDEDDFTLSRSGPMTVEELDLAPMVDVAFQLVLFFMVAAQTVIYKTLEIPKPSPEAPPSAVAQGRSRTLDDFKDDFILVEIDPAGAIKIDREPVTANMETLVELLRKSREKTGRQAMMLSADFNTRHRNSVLAYDAANEIGLRIVIARPASPKPAGPSPFRPPTPAQAPRNPPTAG